MTALPVPVQPVVPPAPAPADPFGPAEHALVLQANEAVRDLDALVKRGVLSDPEKPDAGDITTRCASIEGARPRLEALSSEATALDAGADSELRKLVAECKRLCLLEVPLLNANHALKQASLSPSQASRRLMCNLAQKDLEKARSTRASDRRIRELDARIRAACR